MVSYHDDEWIYSLTTLCVLLFHKRQHFFRFPSYKVMGDRRLRSLSLFSGIGGLDISLKGVLKTLVYCEIDPYALSVLHDQMSKGALHKAVVNTDSSWIRTNVKGNAEAIVAGWPCPGHSGAGNGRALLIREVVCSVRYCG